MRGFLVSDDLGLARWGWWRRWRAGGWARVTAPLGLLPGARKRWTTSPAWSAEEEWPEGWGIVGHVIDPANEDGGAIGSLRVFGPWKFGLGRVECAACGTRLVFERVVVEVEREEYPYAEATPLDPLLVHLAASQSCRRPTLPKWRG